MKKHTFTEAMDIFAEMFEGWNIVDTSGVIRPITSADPINRLVANKGFRYGFRDCSHLEQTKPMNGDEVWAWDDDPSKKSKFIYIGKTKGNLHACFNKMNLLYVWGNVELISSHRKITIQEATEMLKGIITEPFEIIKE